uniref:Ig-like domain-containing protein n=1 Tax=Ditylenchus dipsaci TaxID=166011 RepID=A0A915D8U7_9BILA
MLVFACSLLLLYVFASVQSFDVQLSPNPAVLAVGHRPVGMPLAILCIVTDVPDEARPGIVWTKSQGDISETGNVEVRKVDFLTLSLQIHNSSIEDSGVYICTASYNQESRMTSVDVNIFEELVFLKASMKLTHHPMEHQSTFRKGITAITNDSNESAYTFYENGQVLEISHYNSSVDEANYQCKVFDKRTGFVISRQIKVGGIVKKRQQFCSKLCDTLCSNLYGSGGANESIVNKLSVFRN